MNILLRFASEEPDKLLISSTVEESFNTLLKYLDKCNIAYVDMLPQKPGLFCLLDKEDGRYDVLQSVYNKEDDRYDAYHIYSLEWLFFDKLV